MYVEAPKIALVTPASVTIFENETLEINVDLTGVPQPDVTWRKDNEILDDDPRFTITGSNLSLPNVQPTDAGEYTITAQNIADTEVERYNVIVQCELQCRHNFLKLNFALLISFTDNYNYKKS